MGDARGGPRVSGAAVKDCRGARNQAASTWVEGLIPWKPSSTARMAAWPFPRPCGVRLSRDAVWCPLAELPAGCGRLAGCRAGARSERGDGRLLWAARAEVRCDRGVAAVRAFAGEAAFAAPGLVPKASAA